VLANGGVAGVLALLSSFFPLYDFYPLYLAAVTAAAADTWGTEIGVLAKGRVISIVSLKPVPAGTSGGISIIGTIGGVLGAMTVAVSGLAWYGEVRTALVIGAAGIAGSLVDSLLGATIQARFRCPVCGAQTERAEHCGRTIELRGGVGWMRNDLVNAVCTLVGALIAWVMI
jgi:uncharacterized protein (TIGR00297 family)